MGRVSLKMTRLVKVLGVAVLLVAGMAAATEMTTTTGTFRYKMTVEVETPEGLKTGSAVREVKIVIAHPEIQGLNDTRAFVKGEAVVVDLGKRGLLFAILGTDDYRTVFDAFPDAPPGLTEEGIKYYQKLAKDRATGTLTIDTYPRLIHFHDINNPKTVELVYETEDYETPRSGGVGFVQHKRITKDFFKNFYGDNVKLKNIKVQMTEEPIVWNIEKKLVWLNDIEAKKVRLNGNNSVAIFTNNLSDNLGAGSFRTR